MKALTHYIATSMVENPQAVHVRELRGDNETTIELRVAPRDVGTVVGRNGRTARALRALLALGGKKAERRFRLEIVE